MSNFKLLLPLLLLAAPWAHADDCDSAGSTYDSQIADYNTQIQNASDEEADSLRKSRDLVIGRRDQAREDCRSDARAEAQKQKKIQKAQDDCNKNIAAYPSAYAWDSQKNKCINKAEQASSKSLPDNDADCSSANVFSGDLKGQNCKKAANVVKDARARTSAITDATTAATTGYAALQATGATGNQDDAQTRQANIYKTLAFSKFATGLVNLVGAAQLKTAAGDAESASSTITGSMKNIQAACANADDDQACFYQNAPKYGIPNDQRAYASYDRMKRGAQQSQDQADQANALAKTSMITGAADMMTGLQAMQASRIANNNAQQLAPVPLVAPPPPNSFTNFGDGGGGPSAPSMEAPTQAGPIDYGNPKNAGGAFGSPRRGPMGSGMVAGKMGVPTSFKPASSLVSGGGGGGGVSGGFGGGGKPGARPRRAPSNTSVGEYNLAGAGGANKGGGSDKKSDDNPLADMLAKMFPQDQQGKPVVDTRQIASAAGAQMPEEEASQEVTSSELSIFEQISAKYHQLNGDGRF